MGSPASRFVVHWGRVPDAQRPAWAQPPGKAWALFAVWPAPVNPDVCFAEAGFTDFGDSDMAWEHEATALWQRLLQGMQVHGTPRLASPPLAPRPPWHQRVLRRPAPPPHPLLEQLELAMQWDSLPPCQVVFGEHTAGLRSGNGHALCWVLWPAAQAEGFATLVQQLAGAHPLRQTPLQWPALTGERSA
jgi:hypothetical protein